MAYEFDLTTERDLSAPGPPAGTALRAVVAWPAWWRSVRKIEPLAGSHPTLAGTASGRAIREYPALIVRAIPRCTAIRVGGRAATPWRTEAGARARCRSGGDKLGRGRYPSPMGS